MYPHWVWDIHSSANDIYLTFDDGPHPEATPFVLNQLNKFEAKATFFCVGNNVRQYPEIVNSIVACDHVLGNHTYNHLNGRKSDFRSYIKNVNSCNVELNNFLSNHPIKLFRPPYGRITAKESRYLRDYYNIIMWDYLSGDFDRSLPAERCLSRAISNIRPGSIIVFHDSKKAFRTLQEVLPSYLKVLYKKGFKSKALTPELLGAKHLIESNATPDFHL